MTDLLRDFWFGHAALGDAARVFLYGGLLVLAATAARHSPPFGDSPLQAPEVVAGTDPRYHEPQGAMRLFGRWGADPRVLRAVRAAVLVCWVGCIAGLGGRIAPLVVGAGALFLHGAMAGALGTNHRWVVPVYVLAAAPLVDLTGDGWPAAPSGFLAQFALLAAVHTLFAGGVSKLRLGGPRWGDGETIRFHVLRPGVGASPRLKAWLGARPWACRALSTGTLALELGAPLALFVPAARLPVLAGAALLHLGIWLTMNPNYLPQTWCYALCVGGAAPLAPATGFGTGVAWAATALALGLLVVALRGVERWPLTCVPMYAFYRGPAGSFAHAAVSGDAQARRLADEFVASGLPYPLAWSERWVAVAAVAEDGTRRELRPAGVLRKHWNRVLHRTAALELARPAAGTAQAFLDRHREALLAGAGPARSLELVWRTRTGERALASVDGRGLE